MELLSDENVNPSDGKTNALIAQGLLSEKLFPEVINIKSEPLTDTYTIEPRPFARGKFATVRRCRHKISGQDFAAKCIRKRRRAADVRQEIIHEVCILRLASTCKRIVKLHEVYETSTELILVLEMLAGGELQRLIDDEVPITESDVARLIRQVLEGLSFLHESNIAHLDIKPQNVLLTSSFPQCDVKLCDFGISRMMTKGVDIREIVGTPDYVAPEVLQYEPICLATDMWSMGILTYVLLSGHTPFGGDNKQETFCNITNGHLEFPAELFGEISNDAKDFIRRLLVREPSERLSVKKSLKHSWISNSGSLVASVPVILTPVADEKLPENALERQQLEKRSSIAANQSNPAPLYSEEERLALVVRAEHRCGKEESKSDAMKNETPGLVNESRKMSVKLEEPSEEIAIVPFEAVIEVTNPDVTRRVEERLDDDSASAARRLQRRDSLGILKEHQLNHHTSSEHHANHHTSSHHQYLHGGCNTTTERQTLKTKSEVVEFEFEGLNHKRLLVDLVDERMRMAY